MNKLRVTILIIIPLLILALEKKLKLGLIIDVPLLLITLYLILRYRLKIASWFRNWPIPKFLAAVISSLPFMLFEENMNCLPTGCRLIPPTIPILTIFIIALLTLSIFFKVRSINKPVIIFSIFGVILEMTYGAAANAFRALPTPWLLFFVAWVFVSYVYISVVPMVVLTEK